MRAYGSSVVNRTGPLAAIAGDYFRGEYDWGFTLRLHSDGRFKGLASAPWGVSSTVEGSGAIVDGELVLSATEADSQDWMTLVQRMRIIGWDRRLYLVPDKRRDRFIADIAKGDEPRSSAFGEYALREGDWQKPPTGKPVLPPAWWPPLSAVASGKDSR